MKNSLLELYNEDVPQVPPEWDKPMFKVKQVIQGNSILCIDRVVMTPDGMVVWVK